MPTGTPAGNPQYVETINVGDEVHAADSVTVYEARVVGGVQVQ